MDEQQEREQRGLIIAATSKLKKAEDGRWFVPSQSGNTGTTRGNYYEVKPDPIKPYCSCPGLHGPATHPQTYLRSRNSRQA